MESPHVYPEGCVFNSLADIAGKKITVMGLGLNGGGEACVRFFLRHGAAVTVTDMKDAAALAPTIERLARTPGLDASRLRYVLGEHRLEDFAEADCVIKNPGVKYEGNRFLAAARAVETDLSIFLRFTKAPVIAVTGSKGKSSTVSAIAFGLKGAGFKTFLGGNITVSPLNFLEQTDGTTPVVLELSSWQLRDLRGRGVLRPRIAVITKIVPDHQNFYGDMDSYVADKRLIYADQAPGDYTLVDFDADGYAEETAAPLPGCRCWGDVFASETKAAVLRYSRAALPEAVAGAFLSKERNGTYGYVQLPAAQMSSQARAEGRAYEKVLDCILVPGLHNRANALNAALVMRLMNVAPAQICAILAQWNGLPHRLEYCHSWSSPVSHLKAQFYNDSCATVPEAAAAASQSFMQGVILIAGGTDKELDFSPLAQALSSGTFKPRQVYLLAGTGTDKLEYLLQQEKVPCLGPFGSLPVLLGVLKADMLTADAPRIYGYPKGAPPLPVVFSPGATSFGMFKNEFDRGNQFKDAVKEIFA